ncbi:hypothetical protein ACIBF7_35290 [Nonomuraea sp. NPDC050478]
MPARRDDASPVVWSVRPLVPGGATARAEEIALMCRRPAEMRIE